MRLCNPVKIDRVQNEGGRKTAGKQHRLSVPANEWQTIWQNKRPPCKQRTRKAAKRERLTDHIPQPFYHTRQPTSSPAPPLKVLWMGTLVSGGLADPGLQLHSKKIFRAFRYRFFLKNHHINKQHEKRMQQ